MPVRLAMLLMLASFAAVVRGDEPSPDRLLLFVEGGPLVVDVHLTLDGRPRTEARDQIISELIGLADTDGDGRPSWGEAILNPRFPNIQVGRPVGGARNAPSFDGNSNEIVDREEVVAIVERTGGRVLEITPDRSRQPATRAPALLDPNDDGQIDANELETAFARFKVLDANDDDVLDRAEIQDVIATQRQGRADANVDVFVAGTSPSDSLPATAKRLYAPRGGDVARESWSLVPDLFDRIDANSDGRLEEAEYDALLTEVPAHLELRLNIGNATSGDVGIEVLAARGPFDGTDFENGPRFEANLPTTGLVVRALEDRNGTYDYTRTAESFITRADSDSNGYLEKSELQGNPQGAYVLRQFDAWDADGDGKVYVEEIVAAYDRQMAPRRSQVVITAGRHSATMFDLLDANGDGRLGLRELRNIRDRIASRDTNGDGTLQPSEMPGRFTLDFGRGGSTVGGGGFGVVRVNQIGGGTTPTAERPTDGPRWFMHADVNRDGDLSPREFLGPLERFRELDRDGDGLIDRDEAEHVESAESTESPAR